MQIGLKLGSKDKMYTQDILSLYVMARSFATLISTPHFASYGRASHRSDAAQISYTGTYNRNIICNINRPKNGQKGLDIIENINYSKIMDINIPFIDKILSLIVSHVSPDQIVLFGSYARGDNTKKSDIDLLITKKDLKNSSEMTDLLYRVFYNNKIGIPVDLIVMDYNKYLELNNEIGYIYKTIKQEGKLLYGTL